MAEIIGVAASATQLGIACFSLIDIVRKIKGGASTLERYYEQLQELQSISTCISQNPLLQTAEIGTQTDALLYIINNNCINSLLRKGRLLRTWGFLYREQDLLDIFVRLERQKSNLSLAIEQIQSQALYQIQTDIRNMAEWNTDNMDERNTDDMDEKKPSDYRRASRSLVCGVSSRHTAPSNTHCDRLELENYIASVVPPRFQTGFTTGYSFHENEQGSSNNSNNRTSKTDQNHDTAPGPSMWSTHNYSVAEPGFDQINGDVDDYDGPLSSEFAQTIPRGEKRSQNIYNNPMKIGFGDQFNGHLNEVDRKVTTAPVFRMSGGTWNNARCIAWPSTDPSQRYGRQYNGNVYIRCRQTADASSEQK
ncbi:hypothetical protein KAF25_009467 [Fusarium avenaceum]|uniref:Uncharacterized protein n=1 Tax=Fusarium avenaceum TaxID=40199 RepID=A0A9P7H975_9HYPO|nr:hypothetical protein KAF25_009467 [Fusarium avenaceum]